MTNCRKDRLRQVERDMLLRLHNADHDAPLLCNHLRRHHGRLDFFTRLEGAEAAAGIEIIQFFRQRSARLRPLPSLPIGDNAHPK